MTEKSENELIAKFEGLHTRTIPNGGFPFTAYYWEGDEYNWFSLPEYDKDWNSLIRAINKIRGISTKNWTVKKINQYLKLKGHIFQDLTKQGGAVDVAEVQKAVVEFIKWHNQQNP